MKNPYIPIVLSIVPRILTHLDRDPQSPSYGCFDRDYWLLKIRPFAGGILQQGCLTLAYAYNNDFEGNIYYGNERIKAWGIAAVKFQETIQNKDGSFDEYFKREGSFPATAFAAYAAAQSCRLFNINDASLIGSLALSAEFLSGRTERLAVNQEIAAICAIYSVYLLTKDNKFLNIAQERIDNLKILQSQEGYFPEHGGMDVGYLTVSLDYLAALYDMTLREDLRQMCEKAIGYLSYFIHPDGTLGGIYGSRNTEYFAPAGFEILSRQSKMAQTMIDKLLANIVREHYLNLSIDDRYLLHYLGPSFLKAASVYQPRGQSVQLPYQKSFSTFFKESRIYINSASNHYFIASLRKGGSFKLFCKGRLLLNDLGYKIIRGKKTYCSEFEDNTESFEVNPGSVKVSKAFSKRGYYLLSPLRSAALHLYAWIFKNYFWNFFRSRFIQLHKRSGYSLARSFIFKEDKLVVEDSISVPHRLSLIRCANQSIKINASSKFFQLSELDDKSEVFIKPVRGSVSVRTQIDLKDMVISCKADTLG